MLLRCAAGNSTVQLGTVGNAGERSGTPGARGSPSLVETDNSRERFDWLVRLGMRRRGTQSRTGSTLGTPLGTSLSQLSFRSCFKSFRFLLQFGATKLAKVKFMTISYQSKKWEKTKLTK